MLSTSLAGLVPKISVQLDERGPVIAVRGAESNWIAKFASPQYPDLPRIEHATMQWAAGVGLLVPKCKLDRGPIQHLPDGLVEKGGEYFLIERFDRGVGNTRVHQLALPIGKTKRFEEVESETFAWMAKLIDQPLASLQRDIRQIAERVRTWWSEHAVNELGFSTAERKTLEAHMRKISL